MGVYNINDVFIVFCGWFAKGVILFYLCLVYIGRAKSRPYDGMYIQKSMDIAGEFTILTYVLIILFRNYYARNNSFLRKERLLLS